MSREASAIRLAPSFEGAYRAGAKHPDTYPDSYVERS